MLAYACNAGGKGPGGGSRTRDTKAAQVRACFAKVRGNAQSSISFHLLMQLGLWSRWDLIFDQLNENNVKSVKAKEAQDLIKKGYVNHIRICLCIPF